MNTKKTIVIAVVTLTVLLTLGAGAALAQTMQPGWGTGFGSGMMGGFSGMMGGSGGYGGMMSAPDGFAGSPMGNFGWMAGMHEWMLSTGGMQALIWETLAEKLGLTADELNAQLTSGLTLTQIAEAQGVSLAELAQTLEGAMQAALDQAVADGAITQAQADQMLSHMARRYEWMLSQMGAGFGSGAGGCHGGFVTPDQGNS